MWHQPTLSIRVWIAQASKCSHENSLFVTEYWERDRELVLLFYFHVWNQDTVWWTIYTVCCYWYFLAVYLFTLPFLKHFYSLLIFFPLCHWPGCLSPSDIFHQMTADLLLTQVARTITNMQQQIQQHQRQLYQALLMKQQQQLPSHSSSSSSSAGLHPPGGPVSSKSILDPFTGPHQASGLADSLHTKEPPSSPNAYNTYPLCKAVHQCCALAIILKAIIINSKN